MIDLRKLVALDIALLGPKVILAEFVCGVVLPIALAILIFVRAHSLWQVVLSIYFLCLGINYAPMLGWAIQIANRDNARAELGDELIDKGGAMAKYRRISLVLLVPLMPLILMIARGQRRSGK